jgi:hypothetical protein
MKSVNPFESMKLKLRVPLKQGEVEVSEIVLRPPTVKDILMGDGHDPDTAAYIIALASSMSGIPEIVFRSMVPEDYADLRVLIAFTHQRFTGSVNLLDKKEESENPTEAASIQPQTSGMTSGE